MTTNRLNSLVIAVASVTILILAAGGVHGNAKHELEHVAVPAVDCPPGVFIFRPAYNYLPGYSQVYNEFGNDDSNNNQPFFVCRTNVSGILYYGKGYEYYDASVVPNVNRQLCWIAANGTEVLVKSNIQYMYTIQNVPLAWLNRCLFKNLSAITPGPAVVRASTLPGAKTTIIGRTYHYSDEGLQLLLPGVVKTTPLGDSITVTYGGAVYEYTDYFVLFCIKEGIVPSKANPY